MSKCLILFRKKDRLDYYPISDFDGDYSAVFDENVLALFHEVKYEFIIRFKSPDKLTEESCWIVADSMAEAKLVFNILNPEVEITEMITEI